MVNVADIEFIVVFLVVGIILVWS